MKEWIILHALFCPLENSINPVSHCNWINGSFPNFINSETLEENWPSFIPGKQLVLGLDLQGGSYLLFEVDKEDYQQKQLKKLVGEVRNTLREAPRIGYTGLVALEDSVQVRIRES